jgi:D-amino-acid dehydrogenase
VLRLYSTEQQFKAGIELERSAGSLDEVVSLADLARIHPVLSDACANQSIAGAAKIKGFSLRVHDFGGKIIKHLRESGARVEFDSKVTDIIFDTAANVSGVSLNGQVVSATHYVFSPGAYLSRLLSPLDDKVDIHAVTGAWLKTTIPFSGHERVAFKLNRSGIFSKGAAEGANIFIEPKRDATTDILISSVHGYTGKNPREVSKHEYEPFRAVLEDVLTTLFPRVAEHYFCSESSREAIRYCHRPWTSSCLGIFSIRPASNGLALITGGHNTGGFSQSTAVARAVLDAINGRHHSMHTLYHPARAQDLSRALGRVGIEA